MRISLAVRVTLNLVPIVLAQLLLFADARYGDNILPDVCDCCVKKTCICSIQ